VGVLGFEEPGDERSWSEDDLALVDTVRQQLALTLENRLLFEQTAEALAETSDLYKIGQQISEAQDVQAIVEAASEGVQGRGELDGMIVGLMGPLGKPEAFRVLSSWDRRGEGLEEGREMSLEAWSDFHEVLEQGGRFVATDVNSASSSERLTRFLRENVDFQGLVGLPLRVRDEHYGTVVVYTSQPHEWMDEELRFYETVARNVSVALENLVLLQHAREEAERRALLNEVMQTASSSLNTIDLLHNVGLLVAKRLEMPTMLLRWDGEYAEPVAIHRPDASEHRLEESVYFHGWEMPGVGAAIRRRESILWHYDGTTAGAAEFQKILDELHVEDAVAAPLMVRNEVLGVLFLGRHTGHDPIDENEINFVRSAAVNIGVALENARLYQDAQETAEKLKEVDRLKSEFLANMSHELRTPLNSIIGFSRVILKGIDGPVTEMQQTDLQAIYDSGKHLLNLINDVLDLSKIEAGRMEFIFEPTDLHEVVSGVMSTAIALVKEKPIELQQDVPEELTPVVADERRIRQVILNLVGNASKFTEEGYIKVAAWREDEDVIVAVEDTGIGIPRDRYHSVFKEFEQVDSSSTRRYGGTGLGLPVSKKFVEAHGGEIWFESEVNVGTTFYVRLPIAGPSPEEPEEDETRADGEEALIVLTVDDDDGVITLFRRYLEKQGYRVMALTRGDRVVEEAKRIRPYAITLDIFLPDINGWEIVQALKSDPETRDIPIIVCSISNDRDKGLSMGVADYLVKPILEQDLLDALERVSDGGRPRDILVVDDTAEDRGLLRRILEGADYHVREATGGAEAIDLIHATPPELVVLDLMMPDVDGFAVLEELKSDATTRDIPVVVVTAKELTAAERALLTLRVESLLEKGIFDQENLLEDVGAALARLSEG
jgi:signal transduction histidine kinase/CheY-like chemotaxis protein